MGHPLIVGNIGDKYRVVSNIDPHSKLLSTIRESFS